MGLLEDRMYIYYQLGIVIGLILVILAIHIAIKQRKTLFPFNIANIGLAFIMTTLAIYIIVASLGALQPQNWYANSALWKFLIVS